MDFYWLGNINSYSYSYLCGWLAFPNMDIIYIMILQ